MKYTPSPLSNSTSDDSAKKIDAFRELRDKLEKDGWFVSSKAWYLYKNMETISLLFLGLYLFGVQGYWLLGALFAGLGYQQLGWLGHDYCHMQVFQNRKINNFMAYIIGPLLNGFSVNWWKDRHNSHHAVTNVLDADPDVDNLPLFCWSEDDIPRIKSIPLGEKIIPFQKYYFIPFTFTLKFIWLLQSAVFALYPEPGQNKSFMKALRYERACLATHYVALLTIVLLSPCSWLQLLGFVVLSEMVGGAGIALIVFMNHYACEQLPLQSGKDADFLTLQLETTRNIDPGFVMNWLSGGLNLQVEHHLFPTMPRHNLLKVRPIVQKFCATHSLPYQTKPFFDCLMAVESKLGRVSTVVVNEQQKRGVSLQ